MMADERDPKVSGRYRELPGEEPSRELDQAILAAARRAADRPHAPLVAPAGRHRWYYSLAAAAIVVLAVAVTVHMEHQQPDGELGVPVAPARVEQQEKPASSPAASTAAQAKRDMAAARQERRPAYAPEPPAAPAAAPPAPSAQQDARGMAGSAMEEQKAAKEAVNPESGQAPAAAASRATPSAMAAYALDPLKELERIAELRRQGRDDEADRALGEFRKRYPGYEISQEMRAKVERRPAR